MTLVEEVADAVLQVRAEAARHSYKPIETWVLMGPRFRDYFVAAMKGQPYAWFDNDREPGELTILDCKIVVTPRVRRFKVVQVRFDGK